MEKGLRSERALAITLADVYVQGVSTRKVKAITEQLCGTEISSTQVSRATAQLDAILQEWRERILSEIAYLYVRIYRTMLAKSILIVINDKLTHIGLHKL